MAQTNQVFAVDAPSAARPSLKVDQARRARRLLRLVVRTLLDEGYWLSVEQMTRLERKSRVLEEVCEQAMKSDAALVHVFRPNSALPTGAVGFSFSSLAVLSSWTLWLEEVIPDAIELSISYERRSERFNEVGALK